MTTMIVQIAACLAWIAVASCVHTPPHQADPYAKDAPALSKEFSNERLKALRFNYHPARERSMNELRAIRDPVKRAKADHPDAKRQTYHSHVGWYEDNVTNAAYVDRKHAVRSKALQARMLREREQQQAVYEQTGTRPPLRQSRLRQERMKRARSAGQDDIVRFRSNAQPDVLRADPQNRTNAQYCTDLDLKKKIINANARKRYKAKKERERAQSQARLQPQSQSQLHGVSNGSINEQSRNNQHASPHHHATVERLGSPNPSSGSSIDWNALSDLEPT